MRLLVCTQAVDLDDPVLGFFHRWLEEFADHVERIEVLCLKKGRYALPRNVHIHSLGKEDGASRGAYVARLYRHVFALRGCDAVFVHMNEEYILLAGLLWRLFGTRVVLWRNHAVGTWRTSLAGKIAHVVCYTSPLAYVANFKNAVRMPIGIDTHTFAPMGEAPLERVLFLGRLDEVKRPDIFLTAIEKLSKSHAEVRADVYGDPTPGRKAYADELKKRFAPLSNVAFRGAVSNDTTPAIYQSHGTYVNLTPSGSFDKTIGEAAACGCILVVANEALRDVLPTQLLVNADSPDSVAKGIKAALALSEGERRALSERLQAYVRDNHSLELLRARLLKVLYPSFS
jgi:glycosyltransferase involved in cell wall biosynthesis